MSADPICGRPWAYWLLSALNVQEITDVICFTFIFGCEQRKENLVLVVIGLVLIVDAAYRPLVLKICPWFPMF